MCSYVSERATRTDGYPEPGIVAGRVRVSGVRSAAFALLFRELSALARTGANAHTRHALERRTNLRYRGDRQ